MPMLQSNLLFEFLLILCLSEQHSGKIKQTVAASIAALLLCMKLFHFIDLPLLISSVAAPRESTTF